MRLIFKRFSLLFVSAGLQIVADLWDVNVSVARHHNLKITKWTSGQKCKKELIQTWTYKLMSCHYFNHRTGRHSARTQGDRLFCLGCGAWAGHRRPSWFPQIDAGRGGRVDLRRWASLLLHVSAHRFLLIYLKIADTKRWNGYSSHQRRWKNFRVTRT